MCLKVVLLGYGAIGKSLHGALARHPRRVNVLGVLNRTAGMASAVSPTIKPGFLADADADERPPALTLAEALESADLIVECASPAAVRALGPAIIASGTDMLIASLGALVDDTLRASVMETGPGRAYLSTGAIGGLDLIRASAGTIDSMELQTRKLPGALLHAGLPQDLRAKITAATTLGEPQTVFAGTVAHAVELFPSNINVAAALGLAAGDFGLVKISITADPTATLTSHSIHVQGSGGTYRFGIENAPDPQNPATSALTARAMASGILRLAGAGPHFI